MTETSLGRTEVVAETLAGQWWNALTPEEKRVGVLRRAADGAVELDVMGTLGVPPSREEVADYAVVHGFAKKGERLTLLNCQVGRFEAPAHGATLPYVTYGIDTVLRGCHLDPHGPMCFSSILVDYQRLTDWVCANARCIKMLRRDESEAGEQPMAFACEVPNSVKCNASGTKVEISFGSSWKTGPASLAMNVGAYVSLTPSSPLPLKEMLNGPCKDIQNFLSLAMGSATHPVSISGFPDRLSELAPPGQWMLHPVTIHSPCLRPADTSERWIEALFTFDDIRPDLGRYLCNWISKALALKPVYDLYFGVSFAPEMYVTSRFLSYTQALETYHRRTIGGTYLEGDAFAGIIKTVVAAIPSLAPPELAKSIRTRLRYSNEPALRKRLSSLFVDTANALELPEDAFAQYVPNIVAARNYLTHYSAKEYPAENLDELPILTEYLRVVLEACLLREIGFDRKMLMKAIVENYRYSHLFPRKGG